MAVSTNRECQWSVAPSGGWIQLSSNATGQGEGSVPFTVQSNTDAVVRRGAINVGDQQVAITQEAAPCVFTVSPLAETVTPAGERRAITVTASSAQCAWTARSDVDWLSIVSGAQGTGSGEVVYEARPTAGPTRMGSLIVAGFTVTVTQGQGCATAIAPTSQNMGASGGSGMISVTTASGCSWSAQSDVPWIVITAGQTGTGGGTVSFNVGAWNGPARIGTVRVGSQVFTVTQGAGCTTSISPTSQTVGASGGSGTVSVNTAAGCPWSAQSSAPWIAITGGQSGSGPGSVAFSVGSWDGPTRSGTLQVAGHQFTVTQTAGCSYTIDPSSQPVGASGGTGSVNVHTASGCQWTAGSNALWLTITSGGSGTGDGRVQFSAAANTGAQRSGTLTVAGRSFTVTQDAGCTFALSASSAAFDAAGGTGSVTVTAGSGCTWSATGGDTWVRITQGSNGSGSGDVRFTVDQNTGADRSTTLTIAGRTFTVTQSAGCSFSLNPESQSFASGGGAGSLAVNTGAGCGWTATASQPWVHITAGGSGSGPGTVSFTVDANGGAARDATINVGGRSFAVHQNAGCSYSLNPTSASFTEAGGSTTVTVTTGGECSWSATAPDGWARITSGGSGNGSGTVQIVVDPNSSGARTSTLTIAGIAFPVSQSGVTCTYAINPASQGFDAGGGTGSFSMTAPGSCSWSAASSDGWLQITGGSSGSGNGTVSFTAAANTGPARAATISAGGQTFTATQASGCTFAISPSSADIAAAGGSGFFSVTTTTGCAWSASTSDGWIHITTGASGSDSGTVQFTVDVNTAVPRTGSITVGGQTFNINQAGV